MAGIGKQAASDDDDNILITIRLLRFFTVIYFNKVVLSL